MLLMPPINSGSIALAMQSSLVLPGWQNGPSRLAAGVEEVTLVQQDGSPHGPRRFVLWNPPLSEGGRGGGTGGGWPAVRVLRARCTAVCLLGSPQHQAWPWLWAKGLQGACPRSAAEGALPLRPLQASLP